MNPTDFSKYLSGFLIGYLAHDRGVSKDTICAYRDTFVLFIGYMSAQGIPVNRLTLSAVSQSCSRFPRLARNARLDAIHSFFSYIQYRRPEHLYECQKILSIPMKRKATVPMNYLTIEGIKTLLEQPDIRTAGGRRDLALLSLMYDTGARVQEVIDLTPSSLRLDVLNTIRIAGNGNKTRIVSMLEEQVKLLKPYIVEHRLDLGENNDHPLFFNSRGDKLTRAGVNLVYPGYTRARISSNHGSLRQG